MSGHGPIVFDGSVLGDGPWTGVALSFLATLGAYASVAERELVVIVPPGTAALPTSGVRRIDLDVRGLARQTRLPRLLRRLGAALLHSPVTALPLAAPCAAVATVHDLPWLVRPRLRERGVGPRARLALWLARRRAALLLVPSQATARALGAGDRVRVVPHGWPAPARPARAEALCGPFLAIGDDRPRKNLYRVRAAHKMARAMERDLPELRVIGPRSGYVGEDEKQQLLRHGRALVHASLYEGFGLPVLEAMAHGVPILASDDPALRELAADAAHYADPRDVPALARGMVAVHRDGALRAHLCAAGPARARLFTPERSAALWLAAHRELAGRLPARMTHVVVAGWLLATGPSGANRRLLEILRAAAEQLGSNERMTLLFTKGAAPPDLPSAIGCLPVDIPATPTAARALAEHRQLPRLLHELGATVYDQAHLPLVGRLPCPTVLTVHDLRDLTEHRRRPRWLARLTLRRSLARSSYVVVPSQFTWRELERASARKAPSVTVVPNGVSARDFTGIDPDPREHGFLHVGRLEPRKNLMMLLSAYAQLVDAAADPDRVPPLLLAGSDGGERARLLERAAYLEIAGRVQHLDQVDEARLRRLYRSAACVLVPSLYEGFGLPVLEGMAAGRAVLVSDRGALPEIGGEGATVLPADDPAAWARAMAQAAHLERDPFLIAARQRRVRELTWERAAASCLELWHQLSG